jgi:hypothetical protein
VSTLKANTIKPVALSTDLKIQTNDTTRMTLSAVDGLVKLPTSAPGIQFGDGMIQQYAGGKIRQIIYADTQATDSTTSNSLINSPLQATITPRDVNSKIHITAAVSLGGGTTNATAVGLRRGSTDIALGEAGNNRVRAAAGFTGQGTNSVDNVTLQYMDAPASTSAITYKVTFESSGGNTTYFNRTPNDSDSQETIRPISTITLMEVVTGA